MTRLACLAAALLVQACASPTRLPPEPLDKTLGAVVIDTPNVRFFPVENQQEMYGEGVRAIEREMKAIGISDRNRLPPVMIDVGVDGKPYQEMHVDGGAMAQLFLYPPELGKQVIREGGRRERRAYIIRNAALGPNWAATERNTLDNAGRAISTMIHISGVNDLFRVHYITQRDVVDYNLAFIGEDFDPPPHEGGFDLACMNALYEYGYALGRKRYPWKMTPPTAY